ncbi:hypothetical protein SEEN559_02052, partial [Salmonella enterica subsp. enterica serovar Newport str. CVM 21559]
TASEILMAVFSLLLMDKLFRIITVILTPVIYHQETYIQKVSQIIVTYRISSAVLLYGLVK